MRPPVGGRYTGQFQLASPGISSKINVLIRIFIYFIYFKFVSKILKSGIFNDDAWIVTGCNKMLLTYKDAVIPGYQQPAALVLD